MKSKGKEGFFWTSYSDLMTSLFFVMLVLFVLALALLHNKVRVTNEKLEKIEEVYKVIESIDPEYFVYDSDFKRFKLRSQANIKFKTGSDNIDDIELSEKTELKRVGKAIREFAVAANQKTNAEYFVVIEGQSSKDNYTQNDELSYRRALSLMKFWENIGVLYQHEQGLYEVLIAGSGCRSNYRESDESKNQRFVIYIIPKPGEWAVSD